MDPKIDEILDRIEKEASVRAAAGGFVQGMRNVANDYRAARGLRGLINNPQASPAAVAAAKAQLKTMAPHSAPSGLFQRMSNELRGGATSARDAWHKSRLDAQMQHLNPEVAKTLKAAPAAQAAAANPAQGQTFLQRHGGKLFAAGALGLGGLAAWRGSDAAAEQDTRAYDYMNNARHNMATPYPSMTVTAAEKTAGPTPPPRTFSDSARDKIFEGAGNALAGKLVSEPIDALQKLLKKRFVDQPKWDANFHNAVQNDPELRDAYAKNPDQFHTVFDSVKQYSPSLAKNVLGTRSVLRHAMMTDYQMDWNTMKAIAEIEKLHAESKRR